MTSARARIGAACALLALIGLAAFPAVLSAACSAKPEVAGTPPQPTDTPPSDSALTRTTPAPTSTPTIIPTTESVQTASTPEPSVVETPVYGPSKEAPSPTPLASNTPTDPPVEGTQTAIEKTPSAPYPSKVPLEDLTDLCDYSDPNLLLPNRTMTHYKYYSEIDGRFQLENEWSHLMEVNIDTNARRELIVGINGNFSHESRVVDGVKYLQFVLDGKVSAWFADTVTETPPLRKHRPQNPGVICGYPLKWFTVAIDHGMTVVKGVEVRHVSLFSNPSHVDPTRDDGGLGSKLEVWVDSAGRSGRVRHEEVRFGSQPIDGKIGRDKDVTLRTFEIVPPIDILPPETFEKWTGEPFPDSNQ